MTAPTDITQLLISYEKGSPEALEALLPLVYQELRRLAQSYMRRENASHTLQATALVHEAYFRLIDQKAVQWQNRAHFFGVAAQIMRRILVDHARHKKAAKRGGTATPISFDEALHWADDDSGLDLVVLDEAITRLAKMDERQARVVEQRFFGGMSIEEIAEALGVSPATVKRDWTVAKAWLHRELNHESANA